MDRYVDSCGAFILGNDENEEKSWFLVRGGVNAMDWIINQRSIDRRESTYGATAWPL